MKASALIVALMVLIPANVRGGETEELLITRIVIEGNLVTREHVIRREISHPVGQPYDSLLALQDRNRLYNLRIFETVQVYTRPVERSEVVLVVEVRESLRLLALPLVYRIEEVGWSYGGAVSIANFRGLNQTLGISATLGGERTYNFQFFDPWKWGDQISFRSAMIDRYFSHPVYDFRMRESRMDLGLGKYSRRKVVLGRIAAAVIDRNLRWQSEGSGPDPPDGSRTSLRHRTLNLSGFLHLRTMDIWRDPTNGSRLKVLYAPKTPLDDRSPKYALLQIEGAVYRRIRDGDHPTVLAAAASISTQMGEVPFYAQQYLGGVWVRGFGLLPADAAQGVQSRLSAESLVAAAVEIRQTFIPRQLIQGAEWGLAGLLFFDVAWGYGASAPLPAAQPISGFGAGLRLFMPYLDNVGVDLGVNTYNFTPKVRFRLGHKF